MIHLKTSVFFGNILIYLSFCYHFIERLVSFAPKGCILHAFSPPDCRENRKKQHNTHPPHEKNPAIVIFSVLEQEFYMHLIGNMIKRARNVMATLGNALL